MAVLSRIIEDSADEEQVADAVVIRGRSASAPSCFVYEEEIRPVNVPLEEKPKKSKRKAKKRKKRQDEKLSSPLKDDRVNTEKPLTSASSEASLIRGRPYLENLLTMKSQVTPVVDGPLIIDGACAARPSRAEMLAVEEEEAVAGSGHTVVEMADGSRFNFPVAPSSHRHMGSSPMHYDSHDVDQTSWFTPLNEGGYPSYDVRGAGMPSGVSFQTSHTHSYSSGGPLEYSSSSMMGSYVYGSASDPGQPGRIHPPEPSSKHIHTPDSEKYHHENSSISPPVEGHTGHVSSPGKESTAETLSSVTEPGSPSARPDGDSRVADSFSTTPIQEASDESTLILNPGPESISNTTEPLADTAPRVFPTPNKVTYIIVNNDSKQTKDKQHSAETRNSQIDNDMIPPLSTHLQDTFASGKFSDSQIVLNSAGEMFWSITFNAHRVIIDQNPVLSSMLHRVAALEQSKSTLYLMAGKKFALPRAVEFALQNLYGMSLIDKDSIDQFTRKALGWDTSGAEKLAAEKMKEVAMDLTLCYGAVGAFLNDIRIAHAAFELALQSLDWTNLEIALHFGIYPEDFLLSYDDSNEKEHERKAKKGKKGKKKSHKKATEAELPPIHDNLNAQVIQKWAPKIASAAIQFLVDNLPANFLFDRLALSKELQDRIPRNLRTGCSIATLNPNLTSLTFGHHPQPSMNCTRASAVLLALPYLRLRECFEAFRQKSGLFLTSDLLKSILQEREQRRSHALREWVKKNKKNKNSKDYPEWFKQELGYQEFAIQVETRVEGGLSDNEKGVEFSLHREWKGNADGGPVIRKFAS
ncbi:hypothetical protein UA08_07649 [Talaromyces atroroseus]|uniref:BTB domain-containing protein n=1 Tax=Talaromyces atroroseus TaxID=1441469 RepID=A0A225A9I2_TALAT|nr:hypothetical protein UA08_07649 [Talaromyces atroroseus]OKL57412.1 hypothetical protein UA08_07649 [Talaromyces atroroseus]